MEYAVNGRPGFLPGNSEDSFYPEAKEAHQQSRVMLNKTEQRCDDASARKASFIIKPGTGNEIYPLPMCVMAPCFPYVLPPDGCG